MENIAATQLDIPEGVIHLGVGHPSDSLLPLTTIRSAADKFLNRDSATYLAYGAEQGDPGFRNMLARFLSRQYRQDANPDQIFVTAGASLGLDLICTIFTQPGDTIFVEEPTYFLALRIFADHRLNVVGIPVGDDGLIVSALEEQLLQHRPVLVYTIPAFQNPANVTLSEKSRRQLVRLSGKYNFLIVADEVYHLLAYTSDPPAPFASYIESGTVLSLGSFSKILAPGLRLGWVQAKDSLLQRLVTSGLLDSGGGLNPFASGLVGSAIELGLQDDHLDHLKKVYSKRKDALAAALKKHLPGSATFREPDGGYYIWLKLPESIDTEKMIDDARSLGVLYQPGVKFSSQNGLKNYIRLSYSFYDIPELEEGVVRLAAAVKRYVP